MSDTPERNRRIQLTRRGLLTGIASFAALSVVGGARERLVGNPFADIGYYLADRAVDGASNAFAADPESERLRVRFEELNENVQAKGLDRVYPLPMIPSDNLEVVNWLMRRKLTGLANPVIPYNVDTADSVKGMFGLKYSNFLSYTDLDGEEKKTLAWGMNSRFGDKLQGNIYQEAPNFAHLMMLADSLSKRSDKKLPYPFDGEVVTTPEGILPMTLLGSITESGYRGFELRAMGDLVDTITVARTAESELTLQFGKPVPTYGNELKINTPVVSEKFNASWWDTTPPKLERPTGIIEVLQNSGGRDLLKKTLKAAVDVQQSEAWRIINLKGLELDQRLTGMVVGKGDLPNHYHPAKFYVTEDGQVIRSAVKVHYLHIPMSQPLMIVSKT